MSICGGFGGVAGGEWCQFPEFCVLWCFSGSLALLCVSVWALEGLSVHVWCNLVVHHLSGEEARHGL